MPLIRAWTRRSLVCQLTVLCSILIVVCGALVASLIAVNSSHSASREARSAATQAKLTSAQAKEIANCVNDILGTRGNLQSDDTAAITDIFNALSSVLTAPTAQKQTEYARFLTVLAHARHVLSHDSAIRTAHPLGRC